MSWLIELFDINLNAHPSKTERARKEGKEMNKTLNLLIVSLLCMLTAPGMVFARRGGGPGNPVDLAYDAGYRAGLDNNALPVIPIIIGVIVAVAVGVAIGYWVRSRKMAIID